MKIVGVVELRRVDEQGDHDQLAIVHRRTDQVGVAAVQCPHGRHATDPPTVPPGCGDQFPDLFDTFGRPHPSGSNLVRASPVHDRETAGDAVLRGFYCLVVDLTRWVCG